MKSNVIVLAFLLCYLTSYSQTPRISIYIEDNVGRRDTAIIGFSVVSTYGIDSELGEVNIFGTPFDSLDIRVIKRDSINFNCLRETFSTTPPAPNVYYSENIDSKIDIQPFLGTINSIDDTFEILFHATDYPVTIEIAEIETLPNDGVDGEVILLNSECNITNFFGIYEENTPSNPLLFTIEDSSVHTIAFEFAYLTNSHEVNNLESKWTIFPNPTTDQLAIKSEFNIKGQLELINSTGQIVKSIDVLNTNNISINIVDLIKGVYFIRYQNVDQDEYVVKRFVKL